MYSLHPEIRSRIEELHVTAPEQVIQNVKKAFGRALVTFTSKIHEKCVMQVREIRVHTTLRQPFNPHFKSNRRAVHSQESVTSYW
jgi:hypothetical protein